MKVLFYCDWFKEYTSNLAISVSSNIEEVTLIVRDDSPEFNLRRGDEKLVHQKIRDNGLNLLFVKGKYTSFKSFIDILDIYKSVKKKGYSTFHIQQTADPRFLLVALLMPTVLTLHEPKLRKGVITGNSYLRDLINSFVYRLYRILANKIVVHTDECLNALTPFEKKKAIVIPHGATFKINSHLIDNKNILFFGRAAEYKGIDILLGAMKVIWQSDPEVCLRILASPGDYKNQVELDSRIIATWDGYTNVELDEELSKSKVVCMPYTTAAGSGVGAQAYGAGKIVVASDLDGLRELVINKDYLVPPGDSVKLAKALLTALNDEKSINNIDENKSWPKVAVRHISVYESFK